MPSEPRSSVPHLRPTVIACTLVKIDAFTQIYYSITLLINQFSRPFKTLKLVIACYIASSTSFMATIRRQIILTRTIHTDWHLYVQNIREQKCATRLQLRMHAHNNMNTQHINTVHTFLYIVNGVSDHWNHSGARRSRTGWRRDCSETEGCSCDSGSTGLDVEFMGEEKEELEMTQGVSH